MFLGYRLQFWRNNSQPAPKCLTLSHAPYYSLTFDEACIGTALGDGRWVTTSQKAAVSRIDCVVRCCGGVYPACCHPSLILQGPSHRSTEGVYRVCIILHVCVCCGCELKQDAMTTGVADRLFRMILFNTCGKGTRDMTLMFQASLCNIH
jgi:hypothetical protein